MANSELAAKNAEGAARQSGNQSRRGQGRSESGEWLSGESFLKRSSLFA
jgi:hypothetical protein